MYEKFWRSITMCSIWLCWKRGDQEEVYWIAVFSWNKQNKEYWHFHFPVDCSTIQISIWWIIVRQIEISFFLVILLIHRQDGEFYFFLFILFGSGFELGLYRRFYVNFIWNFIVIDGSFAIEKACKGSYTCSAQRSRGNRFWRVLTFFSSQIVWRFERWTRVKFQFFGCRQWNQFKQERAVRRR
jgi:hypothetical protein